MSHFFGWIKGLLWLQFDNMTYMSCEQYVKNQMMLDKKGKLNQISVLDIHFILL